MELGRVSQDRRCSYSPCPIRTFQGIPYVCGADFQGEYYQYSFPVGIRTTCSGEDLRVGIFRWNLRAWGRGFQGGSSHYSKRRPWILSRHQILCRSIGGELYSPHECHYPSFFLCLWLRGASHHVDSKACQSGERRTSHYSSWQGWIKNEPDLCNGCCLRCLSLP